MRPVALASIAILGILASCGRPDPVPRAAAATITDFDHEQVFPLKTGQHHQNVSCNSCHGAFDTFTRYDCLTCHVRPDVDPMHQNLAGYVYESPSCYACHPTGECPGEHCADHDARIPSP